MILASVVLLGLLQLPEADFAVKMERLAAETTGPGSSAIVIKDGRTVYLKAFGLADKEKGTKFTTNTAFEIGSISKQFVGAAILLLVKDKKVGLADKLGQHLPNVPESWRGATIEQTLHHMSGIPDYEEIAGYDYYNHPRSEADIIEEAKKKEPGFSPGAKFEYSNTGYYLLSMIVSRRSGMPVGTFLEEKIFKPASMTSTYASSAPVIRIASTGYHRRSGELKPQPPIAWTSTLGAGGIVSTLDDIARWDAALYTDRILPDDLRNLLWSSTKTTGGEVVPYGFGWFSDVYRDIARQNHSGQTNGFTCFFYRFPEKRTTVFAVTNTYGGRVAPMANALAAHFVPGASMHSLLPVKDTDPDRSKLHLKMLRQAVLAEGDDLITDGIKNFSTGKDFASLREPLKPRFNSLSSFELVKERKIGDSVPEFTYKMVSKEGIYFWVFRVTAGKLSFLSFGDE